MTINDVIERTEHFESHLLHFADLHPGGEAFEVLMPMIRSSKSISRSLRTVTASRSTEEFFQSLAQVEIDAEEVFYLLDQLDMLDKGVFSYLVKEGRDLMKLCLQLYNFLIESRIGIEED